MPFFEGLVYMLRVLFYYELYYEFSKTFVNDCFFKFILIQMVAFLIYSSLNGINKLIELYYEFDKTSVNDCFCSLFIKFYKTFMNSCFFDWLLFSLFIEFYKTSMDSCFSKWFFFSLFIEFYNGQCQATSGIVRQRQWLRLFIEFYNGKCQATSGMLGNINGCVYSSNFIMENVS